MIGLRLLAGSNFGTNFVALRDNESYAVSRGMPARRQRVLAMIASSIPTSLAGCLYAHYLIVASPDVFSFSLTTLLLTMVLVGGAGTIYGPIVAAFVLTVGTEKLSGLGNVRYMVVAVLIVLTLRFLPGGLWSLGRGSVSGAFSGGYACVGGGLAISRSGPNDGDRPRRDPRRFHDFGAIAASCRRCAVSRFAGRYAIVTGAAGSIGAAIAARLLKEGATVAAVDRDREGLTRLPSAEGLHRVTADLASVQDTRDVVGRAIAALGRPADIVVSAAGVYALAPAAEVEEKDWAFNQDINLRAPFFVAQASVAARAQDAIARARGIRRSGHRIDRRCWPVGEQATRSSSRRARARQALSR